MAKRHRQLSGATPRMGRRLLEGFTWMFVRAQAVAALIVTAGCIVSLWIVATRSPLFAITTIDVPPNVNIKAPQSLIGQNLWTVDLEVLTVSLKAQQKDLKRIRAIRRPPHTLQIEATTRLPVAQLKLAQWHAVDEEGYILSQGQPEPWDALIVFRGVDAPNARIRVGKANPTDRMVRALRLAASLRRAPELARHRLQAIDVGDPVSLKLVVDDIEIRCGSEGQLAMELRRLHDVLRTVAVNSAPVQYIDVRFHDPVMRVES